MNENVCVAPGLTKKKKKGGGGSSKQKCPNHVGEASFSKLGLVVHSLCIPVDSPA
jgi:hypothetical protein